MQICNYPGLLSTLKSDPATPLARLLLPQSAGSNGNTLKCGPATPLALPLALALIVAYFFFPASASAHTVQDRKSTRLNSSHSQISYAVFCLKKKNDI